MKNKFLIIGVLASILISATAFYTRQMSEGSVSLLSHTLKSSVFNFISFNESANTDSTGLHASAEEVPATTDEKNAKDKKPLNAQTCGIVEPVIPDFKAEYQGVDLDINFSKGEIFKTTISFKNTGNSTWFSADSGCKNVPIINLGTDRLRDHESIFSYQTKEFESYWAGKNRIKMKSPRVDPGEIAYFEFWSQAPAQDDIFVEYFTPLVEGVSWLDQATAKVVIRVGLYDPQIESKAPFAIASRGLTAFNPSEEKNIIVDVSDQIMHLRIADQVLYTFPVSTGAPKTPTPYGTTKIQFKQEVRVGGKWPHYVMPKFMWFRDGGYGFHALPSLQNDGGTFWREARSHIQRRVSHGCVRLLPEDAEVAFDFAEPGTTVTIQP